MEPEDVFVQDALLTPYKRLQDLYRQIVALAKDERTREISDILVKKYNREKIANKSSIKDAGVDRIYADYNAIYRTYASTSGRGDDQGEAPPEEPAPVATTTATTTAPRVTLDELIQLVAQKELACDIWFAQLIDVFGKKGLELTPEERAKIDEQRDVAMKLKRDLDAARTDLERALERAALAESQCPLKGGCAQTTAEQRETISQQQIEIARLTSEVETLHATTESACAQIQGRLESTRAELERVRQEGVDAVTAAAELRRRTRDAHTEGTRVVTEARDRALAEVEQCRREQAEARSSGEEALRQAESRASAAEAELEAARRDAREAREEATRLSGEAIASAGEEAQRQVSEERARATRLQTELDALRLEADQALASYQLEARERQACERESGEQRTQIDQLIQARAALEEQVAQLNARDGELQDAAESVRVASGRADALERELAQRAGQLEESARQNEEMTRRLTLCEQERTALRDTESRVTGEREAARGALRELERQGELDRALLRVAQERTDASEHQSEQSALALRVSEAKVAELEQRLIDAASGEATTVEESEKQLVDSTLEMRHAMDERQAERNRVLDAVLKLQLVAPDLDSPAPPDGLMRDAGLTLGRLLGDGDAGALATLLASYVLLSTEDERRIMRYVAACQARPVISPVVRSGGGEEEEPTTVPSSTTRALSSPALRLGSALDLGGTITKLQYERMAARNDGTGTRAARLTFLDSRLRGPQLALRTGALTPQLQYERAEPELVAQLGRGGAHELQYEYVSGLGRHLIPASGALALERYNGGVSRGGFTELYELRPPLGVEQPYGSESEVRFSDGTRLYATYVTPSVYSVNLIVLPHAIDQ